MELGIKNVSLSQKLTPAAWKYLEMEIRGWKEDPLAQS